MHIVPWKHSRIFHHHLDPFCAQKLVAFVCHVNLDEHIPLVSFSFKLLNSKKFIIKFVRKYSFKKNCFTFWQWFTPKKKKDYFQECMTFSNIFHFEFYLQQILILLINSTTKLYLLNVKTTLLHLEILKNLAKILGGVGRSKTHIFICKACLAFKVRVKHSSAWCYWKHIGNLLGNWRANSKHGK